MLLCLWLILIRNSNNNTKCIRMSMPMAWSGHAPTIFDIILVIYHFFFNEIIFLHLYIYNINYIPSVLSFLNTRNIKLTECTNIIHYKV